MARELFIYWKLAAAQAEPAVTATARMQADLQARHPGLQARLYRRADIKDGLVTLMEVYSHTAGVGPDLQAAIQALAQAGLQPWCSSGARHVEVFETLGG